MLTKCTSVIASLLSWHYVGNTDRQVWQTDRQTHHSWHTSNEHERRPSIYVYKSFSEVWNLWNLESILNEGDVWRIVFVARQVKEEIVVAKNVAGRRVVSVQFVNHFDKTSPVAAWNYHLHSFNIYFLFHFTPKCSINVLYKVVWKLK